MKNQFNVGDKVQIRPGTSHCRWGWTSTMARWANEGTELEVFEVESNSVTVGESGNGYGTAHMIEPESLRSVGLSVGEKVRIKRGYLGHLGSHIAERAWEPNGTELEVRCIDTRRENRVQVEGPDPQSGIPIAQTVPFDSIERMPESGTDADSTLSVGDEVRIKSGYRGRLNSSLAEEEWKPAGTVLKIGRIWGNRVDVGGPNPSIGNRVSQVIPLNSVERVTESNDTVDTPSRMPTSLASLDQGTVFVEEDGNKFLCMKTDESDDDIGHRLYYRCVVLTGEHTGLIRYVPENKVVTPKPEAGITFEPVSVSDTGSSANAPDAWDLAKTQYGLLEPGDVFRRDQGDGHDCRCFVVALKDLDGDYKYIDDDGDLLSGMYEEAEVYRDDVLTDHGL